MEITKIAARENGRFAIFIEDEYAMSADAETIVLCGLRKGMEITREELYDLRFKADVKRAQAAAMGLLSMRAHARAELCKKLAGKYEQEVCDEALDRIEEAGLIDDEAFARAFAEELVRVKRYGAKRIQNELYKKGVEHAIIKQIVEELEDPSEQLDALIEQKYARHLADPKGVNRTINALARLGYGYEEIRAALGRYLDGLEDEE